MEYKHLITFLEDQLDHDRFKWVVTKDSLANNAQEIFKDIYNNQIENYKSYESSFEEDQPYTLDKKILKHHSILYVKFFPWCLETDSINADINPATDFDTYSYECKDIYGELSSQIQNAFLLDFEEIFSFLPNCLSKIVIDYLFNGIYLKEDE